MSITSDIADLLDQIDRLARQKAVQPALWREVQLLKTETASITNTNPRLLYAAPARAS